MQILKLLSLISIASYSSEVSHSAGCVQESNWSLSLKVIMSLWILWECHTMYFDDINTHPTPNPFQILPHLLTPTQPHMFVLPFSFPPSLSVCPSVCLSLSLSQVCAIRSDTTLEYVQYVKYHITKENWLSFSEQKSNVSTHQWRLGLYAHIPLSGLSLYSLMCAISSLWMHTCICSVVSWIILYLQLLQSISLFSLMDYWTSRGECMMKTCLFIGGVMKSQRKCLNTIHRVRVREKANTDFPSWKGQDETGRDLCSGDLR